MIWETLKKDIEWIKGLFKKKLPKTNPINPLVEDKIIPHHNKSYVIVRSRCHLTPQLKMSRDFNYSESIIKQQIAKDIVNQLINNDNLIEWIGTNEFGEDWIEGRIKIIYNDPTRI